jgi:hypothetical protein
LGSSLPKYLILRTAAGAAAITSQQLRDVLVQSNSVLDKMRAEGKQILLA